MERLRCNQLDLILAHALRVSARRFAAFLLGGANEKRWQRHVRVVRRVHDDGSLGTLWGYCVAGSRSMTRSMDRGGDSRCLWFASLFLLGAACAAFLSFFLRLRFSSFAASLFRLLDSSICERCALVLMTKAGAGTSSSSASDSSSSISESDLRLLRLTIAEEQRGLQSSSSSEEKKAIFSGGMILERWFALTCVYRSDLESRRQLVGALKNARSDRCVNEVEWPTLGLTSLKEGRL